MTNQEQTEYWFKFHRFQQRYEKMYTLPVQKALKTQINQYIETGSLLAVTATPIYAVLLNLYKTVAPLWAASSTVQIRSLKARMPMGFSQRIIDLMLNYYGIDLLNMSQNITDTTIKTIREVLELSALEGFGFDEIVKRLQVPELTRKRARLIARTEVVAAANSASDIAAKETKLVMDKIWIATRDSRTRPHHREVNQKTVGPYDTFTVGGTQMLFPGDKNGGPAEVCNCFLPDQLTSVNPNIINKAFRSFYNGKTVTIEGANGNAFTCTFNHPILTTKGFVPAGELTYSDKLINSSFVNDFFFSDFNINNTPSSFEQVYNSLLNKFVAMRMNGTVMDFYGDGSDRNVDVICSKSLLHNRVKTNELITNKLLQNTNLREAVLFEDSSQREPFNVSLMRLASKRFVGSQSEFLSFIERSFSHPGEHTFASVSLGYTGFFEPPINNASITAEMLSDKFNRLAAVEEFNTFTNVNCYTNTHKISFGNYKGFVYTFETDYQMYDINSFVAKNCRCVVAHIPKRDVNGRLIRI